MSINLGFVVFQLSATQILPLFWAATTVAFFNLGYFLFLWDRGLGSVSRARVVMTVVVGTFIVVGTYASTLGNKTFEMKDSLLLALVTAHGWMAEELVQSFIKKAAGSVET